MSTEFDIYVVTLSTRVVVPAGTTFQPAGTGEEIEALVDTVIGPGFTHSLPFVSWIKQEQPK